MSPNPAADETDAPSRQTVASVRTDGGEAEAAESEADDESGSESDADDESQADESESTDESNETTDQSEDSEESKDSEDSEASKDSEASEESDESDEEEEKEEPEEAEAEETEKEDSEDSEASEEPATIEADDEAVAEQTGDVGVDPQSEEGDTEASEEDGESPSLNGEGDTASIIEVRNQVIELSTDVIGRGLDGIIEVSRTDDTWRAVVEIIERRSVPDTQDILGQYEIELDKGGEVIGYRRLEKYRRSDTGPNEH